jgi:uncharacterized protein (TIGR00106 family)
VEIGINGKREITGCHEDDGIPHGYCLAKMFGKPEGKEENMNVILDLCIVPLGVGVSVSAYVAECQRVIREAGLKSQLHAYGTNIEGDWDAVMATVKRCHERVHAMGAPRITTTIKLGTRIDRDQTMADKVRSVEDKL